jgi:hypothetical protein
MSYDIETLLPCNAKLITLWKANPSHPTLRSQIKKELLLERQKIRAVLQFLLIKNLLDSKRAKAYKDRLNAIEELVENDFGAKASTSCCVHGVKTDKITTCDLTAEAAERFVKGGSKALSEWVDRSLAKVKSHQKVWKAHCKAQPMTRVNWASKKDAYKRISEWAVAECLVNQKKDLKEIISKQSLKSEFS